MKRSSASAAISVSTVYAPPDLNRSTISASAEIFGMQPCSSLFFDHPVNSGHGFLRFGEVDFDNPAGRGGP
jgi:hypothetical protein